MWYAYQSTVAMILTSTKAGHVRSQLPVLPLVQVIILRGMHTCIVTVLRLHLIKNSCFMQCASISHTHTHMHTHTFTHTHAHTLTHTCTHAHTHAHTHSHTCSHTHSHTHAHTHAHTHMHTRSHTCTHVHTHANFHSITTIATVLYYTSVAPVVYWIFLRNYFRYGHLSGCLDVQGTCTCSSVALVAHVYHFDCSDQVHCNKVCKHAHTHTHTHTHTRTHTHTHTHSLLSIMTTTCMNFMTMFHIVLQPVLQIKKSDTVLM